MVTILHLTLRYSNITLTPLIKYNSVYLLTIIIYASIYNYTSLMIFLIFQNMFKARR